MELKELNLANLEHASASPFEETKTVQALSEQLHDRLKANHELQHFRRDVTFLEKFIRVNNYNLTEATVGVRNYYRVVDRNRDITTSIRPTQFRSIYDDKISMLLKGTARSGSKVWLAQPGAWDVSKHTLRRLIQAHLLLLEETVQDKSIQLSGVSTIIDLNHVSFAHAAQFSAKELKRLVMLVQDGFPFQTTAIHIVNYPYIVWGLYFIAQKFMKADLRERIHFHSNIPSLHQHFHVGSLPKSIGGELEVLEAQDLGHIETMLREDKCYEEYYDPSYHTTKGSTVTAISTSASPISSTAVALKDLFHRKLRVMASVKQKIVKIINEEIVSIRSQPTSPTNSKWS